MKNSVEAQTSQNFKGKSEADGVLSLTPLKVEEPKISISSKDKKGLPQLVSIVASPMCPSSSKRRVQFSTDKSKVFNSYES